MEPYHKEQRLVRNKPKFMNGFSFLLAWLLVYTSISCQSARVEYNFINEALPDALNLTSTDSILLNSKIQSLTTLSINGQRFFSREFLENYTHPTLGTNPEKIKKLIAELDFEYLSKVKHKQTTWNIKHLNYGIIKIDDPKKHFPKFKTIYELSMPVFTKDKKTAFIYYGYSCGVDCAQGSVRVYKRIVNRWVFYVEIPIYIS